MAISNGSVRRNASVGNARPLWVEQQQDCVTASKGDTASRYSRDDFKTKDTMVELLRRA